MNKIIVFLIVFSLLFCEGCMAAPKESAYEAEEPFHYDEQEHKEENEWEEEGNEEEIQNSVISMEEAMRQMTIDEILEIPEFAEYFWEHFDFHDYDTDTILTHEKLKEYCVNQFDFDVSDDACINLFETPNSSCFSRVGYSEIWERLVVVFRESGAMYMYYDVSSEEAEKFLDADSLGGYFNKYIKGQYDTERLS